MAIQSFADERTEAMFRGRAPKGLPATIVGTARRKLKMLDPARILDDLKQPPGNQSIFRRSGNRFVAENSTKQ